MWPTVKAMEEAVSHYQHMFDVKFAYQVKHGSIIIKITDPKYSVAKNICDAIKLANQAILVLIVVRNFIRVYTFFMYFCIL